MIDGVPQLRNCQTYIPNIYALPFVIYSGMQYLLQYWFLSKPKGCSTWYTIGCTPNLGDAVPGIVQGGARTPFVKGIRELLAF